MLAFLGIAGQLRTNSAEECVVELAGDAALDLLPRIKAILEELYAVDPSPRQAATPVEIAGRAKAWLATHHPERR
jgi:hypothetical protein